MKDLRLYLAHMHQHGAKIVKYTHGGREAYLEDEMLQDAVNRNFEIMGEAATRLPQEFRDSHPEIPWRRVIGFRNVLIHAYHNVIEDEVWDIVENHLPSTMKALERLLRELGADPDDLPA